MTRSIKIDADFLNRYNKPGPRYTSYPPAPHFSGDFDMEDWVALLKDSNCRQDNISLYFHIPFCPRRCLYCGCNTEAGAAKGLMESYYRALLREMDLVFTHLDTSRQVSQIHFGGGTPNYIPLEHLRGVLAGVGQTFTFRDTAETAIECDPNLLTEGKLLQLRDMGFNRISFGLQDFEPRVLKNVNRKFPGIHPRDLIGISRGLGFRGINLDLIYGLPGQTRDSFGVTIEQTLECGPDRVAVFGYAHVPWQMPHQKALEALGLPAPEDRIHMAVMAHNLLTAGGYVSIGMDHYARPDDALAAALKTGGLHRNFQGYCTRENTGQVYAFGASGISQLHAGYGQNRKITGDYLKAMEENRLPLERVYIMNPDDLFYREVINSLMCRGRLDLSDLAERTGLGTEQVRQKTSQGMAKLGEYEKDGLVRVGKNGLEVTPRGWLVVRCIAMLFDPLLKEGKGRYSRTV